MDYAAELRAARGSFGYVYHRVRLSASSANRKRLVFLVEGEADVAFYPPYLRRFLPGYDIVVLPCWGLGNLRKVLSERANDPELSKSQLIPIVDRDYSDYLERHYASEYYVTDGYSLESILLDQNVVNEILADGLGIYDEMARREIVQSYVLQAEQFARLVKSICAIYFCLRRSGSQLDFDDYGLTGEFDIDERLGFVVKRRMSELARRLIEERDVEFNCADIRDARRKFHSGEAARWLRGKLLLAFGRRFFDRARYLIDFALSPGGSGLDFGEVPLFRFLGGRVSPPQSLIEFCESIKARYPLEDHN